MRRGVLLAQLGLGGDDWSGEFDEVAQDVRKAIWAGVRPEHRAEPRGALSDLSAPANPAVSILRRGQAPVRRQDESIGCASRQGAAGSGGRPKETASTDVRRWRPCLAKSTPGHERSASRSDQRARRGHAIRARPPCDRRFARQAPRGAERKRAPAHDNAERSFPAPIRVVPWRQRLTREHGIEERPGCVRYVIERGPCESVLSCHRGVCP